ncbi:hypothetical protein EBH_0034810 [Eimeria brunetti]|uniref:Uncharacterized protein n=1 Tax=Eimeria brunetti TaxID=51314 RepID=U6LK73_9EIME|nr:hypothetical protein EBH_0034810 [Eimeria brunetti]
MNEGRSAESDYGVALKGLADCVCAVGEPRGPGRQEMDKGRLAQPEYGVALTGGSERQEMNKGRLAQSEYGVALTGMGERVCGVEEPGRMFVIRVLGECGWRMRLSTVFMWQEWLVSSCMKGRSGNHGVNEGRSAQPEYGIALKGLGERVCVVGEPGHAALGDGRAGGRLPGA